MHLLPVTAGAIALAISVTTAPAAADDPPTAGEHRKVQQCLAAKTQSKQPALACIGQVSDPCLNTPNGQTTLGMRQCLNRETAVWDRQLNDNYGRLRAALSSNGANTLRNIQRQWIEWRKAKCQLGYVLYEGGTLASVVAGNCYMRTTALRAIELGEALSSTSDRAR